MRVFESENENGIDRPAPLLHLYRHTRRQLARCVLLLCWVRSEAEGV